MTKDELDDLHAAGVLSPREYDILFLRACGLSQKQIALGLGIHRSTVRNHERNAYEKIDVYREENAA